MRHVVAFLSRVSNSMMRPLQLWLPFLHHPASTSAMKRDQQRVFEAWGGEQIVWLMPGLAHPYGWNEGQDSLDWRLAVPATELECVQVYHIDMYGRVYGYRSPRGFPGSKVTGLLQDWLHMHTGGSALVWAPARPEMRLRVPTFADGMMTYTEQCICLTPDYRVPLPLYMQRVTSHLF